MICEDNHINQEVFSQILQDSGYDLTIAENGRVGLEKHEKEKYALILMDVSMPEMDGIEATKSIRNREASTHCHTPIIGVTAHALKGDMERCLDAGMDDYLSKPINPDELVNKLQQWLVC